MSEIHPSKAWRRRLAWSVVFAANLIVPLMFAWSVTYPSGRVGMFVAIGLLWLLGFEGCGKVEGLGFALNAGGSLVALSQVFPILQMFAGLFSLGVGRTMGLVTGQETDSEFGGCVVTLLTGSTLLAVAAVVGLVVRAFVPLVTESPARKETGSIPEL